MWIEYCVLCTFTIMDAYQKAKDDLARNVRVWRAEEDVAQEDLANNAGLQRAQISQIERKVANPSLRTLVQLATAMGVGVDALLASRTASPPQALNSSLASGPPLYPDKG